MWNDLKFALRMIRTHALFSAVIIATLALSIGVNTTVFTLIHAVLFKPVPVPNGEKLVVINGANTTRPGSRFPVSNPDYLDYKANLRSLSAVEAAATAGGILSEPAHPPARYRLGRVTPGLFAMVQARPVLGRAIEPQDAEPGAPAVVVLSHGVWQDRYGASPAVIGTTVRLNAAPVQIIGVMPPGFKFPSGHELWMPLVPTDALRDRGSRQLMVIGTLGEGKTLEQAGAEAAVVAQQLARAYPEKNRDVTASVLTFHQAFNGGNIRTIFFLMLGAVGCVLLIACANVANLLLGRSISRQREITVRAAMGASRWQLIRQLLLESVVLSCVGGLVGLGLAQGGIQYFDLATLAERPYWITFEMNWTAFGYFAALSIASGLVFGMVPAVRASRVDLNAGIKDGARGSHAGGGRMASGLVVVQFALTMVLLSGAGLLAKSFVESQRLNPGVRADQMLNARVSLPAAKGEPYAEKTARVKFFDELLRGTGTMPGAAGAAITSRLPGDGADTGVIEFEDRQVGAKENLGSRASLLLVSPRYHEVVGLRVLSGRGFEQLDGDAGREAVIVSNEFVQQYWAGRDAVGKRFRFIDNSRPGPWMQVVGVCDNLVQTTNSDERHPLIYLPYRQEAWSGMNLMVKAGNVTALELARPALEVAQRIDPDLPFYDVATVAQRLEKQRWFLPVFGTVFSTFAAIGLLIAAVGIYGIGAQLAASRKREVGIRMALGATPARILAMMMSRTSWQIALGLVIGGAGALAVTGALGSFLVGVSPRDPMVFAAVAMLLVGIGLLSSFLPARQAAGTDPGVALRND